MNIDLRSKTRVLMVSNFGKQFFTTLGEIGRSRGDIVKYFIEVDAKTIDSAIKCYKEDELRAERAELMRKVRAIDRRLNEDSEYQADI